MLIKAIQTDLRNKKERNIYRVSLRTLWIWDWRVSKEKGNKKIKKIGIIQSFSSV